MILDNKQGRKVLAYFCLSTDNQDPNTQKLGLRQAWIIIKGQSGFGLIVPFLSVYFCANMHSTPGRKKLFTVALESKMGIFAYPPKKVYSRLEKPYFCRNIWLKRLGILFPTLTCSTTLTRYLFVVMCNKHWTGAKVIISFIKLFLTPILKICTSKQRVNSRVGTTVVISLPTILSFTMHRSYRMCCVVK